MSHIFSQARFAKKLRNKTTRLGFELLERRQMLAIMVANTNDGGLGSLRDAIFQANSNGNGATTVDTIDLSQIKNQTITLTSGALPVITEPVNFQVGFFPYADRVTIQRSSTATFSGSGLDFNISISS